MGDNNSKPEYPIHKEKINESHDTATEANGRYQTKFNYSSTNDVLQPNEDLIRALIKENRIKNEKIKAERIRIEIEIRSRLEEQECNEKSIREKERQVIEQPEVVKRQNVLLKKEQEITKQTFETEKFIKITSVDGQSPKFVSSKSFEYQDTDRLKGAYIKKQNDNMENRRCIEKQLLGNLCNTEISKLKCTAKKNLKPITQQNDPSQHRKEIGPDMCSSKIEDESKIKERKGGKFKKNKQRTSDFKKNIVEHNKGSNAESGGAQKQVHVNPHSNETAAVRNNQFQFNQQKTTLPAVTKNHYNTQPPPAYSSHSFHYFDHSVAPNTSSLVTNPPAVNYPQPHHVYNIPPPSYTSFPRNYRKNSNKGETKTNSTKVNVGEQCDNKLLKGNRNKQRVDTDGERKLTNKNKNKNRGNNKRLVTNL